MLTKLFDFCRKSPQHLEQPSPRDSGLSSPEVCVQGPLVVIVSIAETSVLEGPPDPGGKLGRPREAGTRRGQL